MDHEQINQVSILDAQLSEMLHHANRRVVKIIRLQSLLREFGEMLKAVRVLVEKHGVVSVSHEQLRPLLDEMIDEIDNELDGVL